MQAAQTFSFYGSMERPTTLRVEDDEELSCLVAPCNEFLEHVIDLQ